MEQRGLADSSKAGAPKRQAARPVRTSKKAGGASAPCLPQANILKAQLARAGSAPFK